MGDARTYLHQEALKGKGVSVEDDATTVSDDLVKTAGDHAAREPPGLVVEALGDVKDQGDAEQGDEDAAGNQ